MKHEVRYEEYVFKRRVLGIFLLFFLFIAFIVSISTGSYSVGLSDLFKYFWAILTNNTQNLGNISLIYSLRTCRALAAVFAGVVLGVSGAMMQCVLRNPLASPYTLGVNQGAALGAAIAIIYLGGGVLTRTGEGVIISNPYVIPITAFIGAMSAIAVVLTLAKIRNLSPVGLILGGVATASFFQALLFLIQYFSTDIQVAAITFWMFGDFGRAYWDKVLLMAIAALIVISYAYYRAWSYNALLMGDDIAKTLNTEPKRIRLESMLIAAFGNAVIVSFVGIIGFVGLIAPHVIRMIIGGNHRYLVPYSALMGAVLLLFADILGRVIIMPRILPVGIVTTIIGIPMLIYLIIRQGESYR